MTSSEESFFRLLNDVVGDKYYIFPQIHLSALLDHKVKGQSWKGAFSHINGKSVDYALCNKETLEVVFAVELDDKSHERTDRIERDKEVDRILQSSNVVLQRFTIRESKDLSFVINQLRLPH